MLLGGSGRRGAASPVPSLGVSRGDEGGTRRLWRRGGDGCGDSETVGDSWCVGESSVAVGEVGGGEDVILLGEEGRLHSETIARHSRRRSAALREDSGALGEEGQWRLGRTVGRTGRRGGDVLVDDGGALGEEVGSDRSLSVDGEALREDDVEIWQPHCIVSFSRQGLTKISGLSTTYKRTQHMRATLATRQQCVSALVAA